MQCTMYYTLHYLLLYISVSNIKSNLSVASHYILIFVKRESLLMTTDKGQGQGLFDLRHSGSGIERNLWNVRSVLVKRKTQTTSSSKIFLQFPYSKFWFLLAHLLFLILISVLSKTTIIRKMPYLFFSVRKHMHVYTSHSHTMEQLQITIILRFTTLLLGRTVPVPPKLSISTTKIRPTRSTWVKYQNRSSEGQTHSIPRQAPSPTLFLVILHSYYSFFFIFYSTLHSSGGIRNSNPIRILYKFFHYSM
jgi:hypothetical protein